MCKTINLKGYLVLVLFILCILGQPTLVNANESEKNNIGIVSLKIDGQKPCKTNDKMKFNVDAIGDDLQYSWSIYKNNILYYNTGFINDSIFEHTLTSEGIYKLQITIKDKYGNMKSAFYEELDIKKDIPPVITSYTMDKVGKLVLGTSVKYLASSVGEDIQYEWNVVKDGKQIYTKPYSYENIFDYKPSEVGNYMVVLNIKDKYSRVQSKQSQSVQIYKRVEVVNNKNNNTSSDANTSYATGVTGLVNSKNLPSKSNHLMYVDTNANKIYVFEGNNYNWTLIRTMSCTDGKPSTPTPKGTFSINSRAPWLTSYSLKTKAKYKVGFYKDYYFHSILYDKTGTKVIDSRIGQSLSNGCIRLSVENAKWIYDNMQNGTTVHIQ